MTTKRVEAESRRRFIGLLSAGSYFLHRSGLRAEATSFPESNLDPDFPIRREELELTFRHEPGERLLSFAHYDGSSQEWKKACLEKLAELLAVGSPEPCPVEKLRSIEYEGVTIEAWIMKVEPKLKIPAYLLIPKTTARRRSAVMAIHGHGSAEPCIGVRDDYHHRFALELAKVGHTVLCPAHRGFGSLGDVAFGDDDYCLDYWRSDRGRQFTLVTDAIVHGKTLVGETVEDLLRWEMWFADARGVESLDVAGISYGGDLALTYPVFSQRVNRIYSSGSLGSFSVIFSRCYNAPAHCVPGVLTWMDRSDIAGLNAPRPIRLHFGEKDTPGPQNNSASYNETVEPSLEELRAIYRAFGAEGGVSLRVTPGAEHEMENDDLIAFLE